jgi:bacterioferritin
MDGPGANVRPAAAFGDAAMRGGTTAHMPVRWPAGGAQDRLVTPPRLPQPVPAVERPGDATEPALPFHTQPGRKPMLRDPKVVEHLNIQLTNELTAINQYFLHARTLRHWGVTRLGRKEYEESIEEMKHADWLIERILFLGGLPNVQRLNQVLVGQSVQEILEADMKLEEKALNDLREGIAYCESVRDYVSRDLLLRILANEEEHEDYLDRQFDLIRQIGIERYILLNSDPAPDQDDGAGAKD